MMKITLFTLALVLTCSGLFAQDPVKLTGKIIGTTGSFDGNSPISNLFDGDLGTSFDSPLAKKDNSWAGLDFGAATKKMITEFKYASRYTVLKDRVIGTKIYGANDIDMDGEVIYSADTVLLFTIKEAIVEKTLASVPITNKKGFRYVLAFFGPDSFGNFGELEFWGKDAVTSIPSINEIGTGFKSYINRNNGITVSFNLQAVSKVGISIYDITGRLVHSEVTKSLAPNSHSINLDNLQLKKGLHLVKLNVNKEVYTNKLVVN